MTYCILLASTKLAPSSNWGGTWLLYSSMESQQLKALKIWKAIGFLHFEAIDKTSSVTDWLLAPNSVTNSGARRLCWFILLKDTHGLTYLGPKTHALHFSFLSRAIENTFFSMAEWNGAKHAGRDLKSLFSPFLALRQNQFSCSQMFSVETNTAV